MRKLNGKTGATIEELERMISEIQMYAPNRTDLLKQYKDELNELINEQQSNK